MLEDSEERHSEKRKCPVEAEGASSLLRVRSAGLVPAAAKRPKAGTAVLRGRPDLPSSLKAPVVPVFLSFDFPFLVPYGATSAVC